MKKAPLLLSLLLLSASSFVLGAPSRKNIHTKRIYIDAEKVKTTDKGIFIGIDDEFIRVSGIFSDKNGHVFIKEAQLENDSALQEKGFHRWHRCWCHNPDCPRENRIFAARKWRKYCSERCLYEAINNGYERHW